MRMLTGAIAVNRAPSSFVRDLFPPSKCEINQAKCKNIPRPHPYARVTKPPAVTTRNSAQTDAEIGGSGELTILDLLEEKISGGPANFSTREQLGSKCGESLD